MNLNFLSLLPASSFRNFKFKTALRIIKLLVVLSFRSSHRNMTRALANFGIGPLGPRARGIRPTRAPKCAAHDLGGTLNVTFPSFGSRRRLNLAPACLHAFGKAFSRGFCAFIASAICHASTSLIATVSNSSSLPSSFKKSSSVVTRANLRQGGMAANLTRPTRDRSASAQSALAWLAQTRLRLPKPLQDGYFPVMTMVSIKDAVNRLAELAELAEKGETVVVHAQR